MVQLDTTLAETLYEGRDTRVSRVLRAATDVSLVVKQPTSDSPSPRTIGRLLHEHQILTKLSAVPGVVRTYGIHHQEGSAALFLVDPGLRSLDRILSERGRLPPQSALQIARAVCHALAGVHAAGVMHKDIKPQNILTDEACTQAVLIDFGVASELPQESTQACLPDAVEGTLAYISPEQTGRTARGLDCRTDFYSLGVTLFELLAGQRPFLETDPLSLVYAHLAKAPPALRDVVPELPEVVCQLVSRCLEKAPEQRYQTAQGLAADLERCLLGLAESGRIEPFALGQKDFSPRLQIPETLLGRESERRAMAAAFERAAQGGVEVLLLGGPSGVGKTALVREIYSDMARAGQGLLLSGKHDQLGHAVPYAALAQAISGLLRNLAAGAKPVFESWRVRIEQALGPRSRVIADLVPELEWLLGPLPQLPAVPTEMAYNRFKLSWVEFVRAVAAASPPLVLFLDDLQWVDPASIELLKALLTDVGRKHLLVIAAYRDNEVAAGHPLWTFIDQVHSSGVTVSRLAVGPLLPESVQRWLAAALATTPERVGSLAETMSRKTHGNPFFLRQLLVELHRQQRVRRNLETGQWEWDQDAVERAAVTENVVELVLRQVAELPERTQEVLGQAACGGHHFSLGELAVLTDLLPAQVVAELRPALAAGLVLPTDGQYREAEALAQPRETGGMTANYRFLHDRVQQAFYELIATEQRTRTHLVLGRRLQAVYEQQDRSDQKLLEVVRHRNLGVAALTSDEERTDLARWNLRAAKAAKGSGSYRLQARLIEMAQALLGARAWADAPQLSVELALERIEADFMLKDFDAVHRRAQELLALPLPALPRLAAQELRIRACLSSGQYGEGERLAVATLAEQGITYPETNEECLREALAGFRTCEAWFDGCAEGFGALPADLTPEHVLCDSLQATMGVCAAFGGRTALGILSMVRGLERSIQRAALTPVAPAFVSAVANGRSALLGTYRDSERWAREGAQAALRLASSFGPECLVVYAEDIGYKHPVAQSREHYQAALRLAMSMGSFQGTSWALFTELHYVDLWSGRPLEQIAAREASQRELMTRAGDAIGQHAFALAASYIEFLRAPKSARPEAPAEWLSASSRFFKAAGDEYVAELARMQEAYLFLAFGEPARAGERAEEAGRFRSNISGAPAVTDIALWRGLAAAKCCVPTLSAQARAAALATLEQAISRLRYFSAGCAENFLHKLRLLEAEHARLHDKTDEAMAKYEEAIALARKERFLHIEGLAEQFCADFHLLANRPRIAALYLQEAQRTYTRWGAAALVSFLEQKHSALLLSEGSDRPLVAADTVTSSTASSGTTSLDVDTTLRAAQVIASELDSQRVVAKLMRLVQENSGAQHAALLLTAGEQLSVAALLSDSQVQVQAGLASPLSVAHPVAHSVIQYVLRSREALLLRDVSQDLRFTHDVHLQAAAIRSVLAVPLLHQGRLGGILYLESKTANSFPAERIHLLGAVAAQAAIALENARLYADLQAANLGLEAKVSERTEALNKALTELWSEMDLARKIQTVLLPQQLQIPGYEAAAVMRPAEQVGGDYYDVFRHGDKHWVLIGDVSGHGVPAGLCMMMIQTLLRGVALTLERMNAPLSPRRLLGLVNEAVEHNLKQIGRGHYMTVTALCLDGGRLRYAGLHQDLIIYRAASKSVERIPTQGVWLGVADGDISEMLEDQPLQLAAGDVLLLYTDGYTEAKVGERWMESAGLAQHFAAGCAQELPCEALIASLLAALPSSGIHDDVTLVALRRQAG